MSPSHILNHILSSIVELDVAAVDTYWELPHGHVGLESIRNEAQLVFGVLSPLHEL